MSIYERRQKIMDLLMNRSPKSVAVNDIIRMMGDSPATIRRDLLSLEQDGYIERVRGYAKYVMPEPVRRILFSEEKNAIGKSAASLVPDGYTIMMDSGSITLAMANHLMDKKDLTVVTNSLSIANAFLDAEIATNMTGGYLLGKEEALVGQDAEDYVKRVKAPLLFLSTTGIRGSQGLSCVTPFQAKMKHTFIGSAEKVVLLIEEKTFKKYALTVFADFSEIDTIITSCPIQDLALQARLNELGVEVIIAG